MMMHAIEGLVYLGVAYFASVLMAGLGRLTDRPAQPGPGRYPSGPGRGRSTQRLR